METLRRDTLLIPQGTTWALQWPISSQTGVAVDVTGWTLKAQIRHTASSPEVLHEWSTALGNAVITPEYVEIRVTATESSSWDWIYYDAIFDAKLILANGEVVRLSQGEVIVSPEVTK